MEKPYHGRTIVDDNADYLTITIPGKRDLLPITWTFLWMIFWGFIGSTAVADSINATGNANRAFMIFWISGWAIMGLMAVKNMIWLIWGREVIEIDQDTFSITRKNDFISREKVYDLSECKNFRIRDRDSAADNKTWFIFYYQNKDTGNIAFDYGMKTFSFGDDLHEAEARYVLDTLKNKGFIPERNFD